MSRPVAAVSESESKIFMLIVYLSSISFRKRGGCNAGMGFLVVECVLEANKGEQSDAGLSHMV